MFFLRYLSIKKRTFYLSHLLLEYTFIVPFAILVLPLKETFTLFPTITLHQIDTSCLIMVLFVHTTKGEREVLST